MTKRKLTKYLGVAAIIVGIAVYLVMTYLAVAYSAHAADLKTINCQGEMVKVKGNSLYHGVVEFEAEKTANGYRLRDCKRNIITLDLQQKTDLSQAVDVVSDKPYFGQEQMKAAVSTFWAAQKLYDYFFTRFNWRGYDNNGTPLYQYVHYGENYFNAQFDSGVAIYGDGGAFNSTAIVSVDYIGHEVSHGVSANTAGLIYQGESGALNESFSDIFGKSFEIALTSAQQASWQMFPDIYRDSIMSTRSMKAPDTPAVERNHPLEFLAEKSKSNTQIVLQQQPKYYRSKLWYFGSKDSGGVHTNSGVQNYWYYLLANGGEGENHLGHHYQITGIGIEKAVQIAWRNLTVYLKKDAQYMNARYGSEQAAIDLFGENSPEHLAVKASWDAVAVVDSNLDKSPQVDKQFTEISYINWLQPNAKKYRAALNSFVAQDAPALPQQPQQEGKKTWYLHSSSSVADYLNFASYQNWQFAANKQYQIRFTEQGGQAMFADATGYLKMAAVQFEVWMLTDANTNTNSDNEPEGAKEIRMIPIVFDIDNNGQFSLFNKDNSPYGYQLDHPAFSGDDDPWTDMIHIAEPKNKAAGDIGYQQFVTSNKSGVNTTAIGETHLQWLSCVAENHGLIAQNSAEGIVPEIGSVFTLKTSGQQLPAKTYKRPKAVAVAVDKYIRAVFSSEDD